MQLGLIFQLALQGRCRELENGMPYVRGETAGMWFRVGEPGPGETLGSIVGRMLFVILSDSRRNAQ